jgi:uncharacterized protein
LNYSLMFVTFCCFLCVFVFVVNFMPLLADPWGKDADLAHFEKRQYSQPIPSVTCQTPLAKWGEAMIRFHQEIISPADGPRSHFIPSSSQYTLNAMKKYGFFKGVMLGCDRLMRENDDPWVYRKIQNPLGIPMKWDPVK